MSEGTKFSIVVVAYECAGPLATLIDSMNVHLGSDVELIVVDNASTDHPERVAQTWKGPGAYLRLGSNHGFGAGVNTGVLAATGETIVVLNPDTKLIDGSLAQLARVASDERTLAGPRVLHPDGTPQASASGSPVGIWPWLRAALPAGAAPRALVARLHPSRLSAPTEVSWLTGSCIAAPRDVLRGLGPFDPSIHMYGEDLDLGIRAGQAGVRMVHRPDVCVVIHYGKASSSGVYSDLGRAQAALNGRSVLRRAYGPRREWLAWMAERTSLAIRVRTKSILGRDSDWERLVAAGLREARPVHVLREFPVRPPEPPAPLAVTRLNQAGGQANEPS